MENMKWIPIGEKLPKEDEPCLITVKPGTWVDGLSMEGPDVYSAFYCGVFSDADGLPYNHFVTIGYNNEVITIDCVTAWMPYPEPYTQTCP